MTNNLNIEKEVKNPSYLENIRHFFDPIDIEHMATVAKMELGTYEGVKSRASQIYFQTQSQRMPPEPERHWSKARLETFKNWIINGYPMGEIIQSSAPFIAPHVEGSAPVRKNAASLSVAEIDRLAFAFRTLQDLPPEDPNSYFALASLHWFPEPSECLHHEPRYNPWHRVLVDRFESALRKVPGCEDITLPYWDIVGEIPDFLYQPPFANYVLPIDVHPSYLKGTITERFPKEDVHQSIKDYGIENAISTALGEASYEGFATFVESAHDNGHVSIGPAMSNADIASFDPIFWFFHCNWERLWWVWQVQVGATDLTKFRSTIASPGEPIWLTSSPFNELPPFRNLASDMIDTSGYDYEPSALDSRVRVSRVNGGSFEINRAFRIDRNPILSIMVRKIERLNVSNSFVVHIVANGRTVAKQAIFQSSDPKGCENCRKRSKLDVVFRIPRRVIAGKKLEVRMENIAPDRVDQWIPNSQVGSPTINVREILSAV